MQKHPDDPPDDLSEAKRSAILAEHGIGKIKHSYLLEMYGENGVNEMKRVKGFFDPEFLLNRNNMFKCG